MADQMMSSDVDSVSKLKRRLHEAAHQQKQVADVLKVLNKLSLIRMTLDILKVTHIGKEVNCLRKWDGEVGDKAKALVKKWKQLLPPDSESSSSSAVNGEEVTGHRHGHKKKRGERVEDGDMLVTHTSHKSTGLSTKDISAVSSETDDFSRALMADYGGASSSGNKRTKGDLVDGAVTHRHKQKHKHKRSHKDSQLPPSSLPHNSTESSLSVPPQPVASRTVPSAATSSMAMLTRPKSPLPGSWLDVPAPAVGPSYSPNRDDTSAVSRKRKANLESTLDSVALTKKSRTQVYSGKKSATGPQAVPSLFDQAMRVLMENIDDIDEVGGVPFFILEPVLQKCTPTQLMRLEEYNEHFLEDSDPLWEKHCMKEFRGCRPSGGQSWRDLYIERLAQREEKLKSLAAHIKAKEAARQEPVRKAMLADVSRMPLRRGRAKVTTSHGGGGFRSRRQEEEHSATSRLKKQTMKMAKQMHQMKGYKPGRR